MQNKIFFRVANNQTEQGLWYDFKGNFTGLIHSKFDFCLNTKLPMPFDKEIIGWLSTTDSLEDLFNWFTKEDILKLEEHGYLIAVYEAVEHRVHQNHHVIKQENSIFIEHISLKDEEKVLQYQSIINN